MQRTGPLAAGEQQVAAIVGPGLERRGAEDGGTFTLTDPVGGGFNRGHQRRIGDLTGAPKTRDLLARFEEADLPDHTREVEKVEGDNNFCPNAEAFRLLAGASAGKFVR